MRPGRFPFCPARRDPACSRQDSRIVGTIFFIQIFRSKMKNALPYYFIICAANIIEFLFAYYSFLIEAANQSCLKKKFIQGLGIY